MNSIKKLAWIVGTLFFGTGILVVINQTAQVVQLAERVHPLFGTVVFWGLLSLYLLLIATPLVMYWRLPRPLTAPPSLDDLSQRKKYVRAVRERLGRHPTLSSVPLHDEDDIRKAIEILDGKANEIIQRSALHVFAATAISQSGRIDALFVLSAQTQLIWRIAHLYYQRPNPRDLFRLYKNVFWATFFAGVSEEIDILDEIEPQVTSLVASGTMVGGLTAAPLVGGIADLALNSIVSGTSNAFLTLRVGCIAKQYCYPFSERSSIKKNATVQAGAMLLKVVRDGTIAIVKALGQGTIGQLSRTVRTVKEKTVSATQTAVQAPVRAGRTAVRAAGAATKKAGATLENAGRAVGGATAGLVQNVARNSTQATSEVTIAIVESSQDLGERLAALFSPRLPEGGEDVMEEVETEQPKKA